MKIEKLQIGKKYIVDFCEKKYPGYSKECYYTGPGTLISISPAGYPANTLEILGDDGELGYYGSEDIIHEIHAKKNHIWIIEFFNGGEWNFWYSSLHLNRQSARDCKLIYKKAYPTFKFRVTKYTSEK